MIAKGNRALDHTNLSQWGGRLSRRPAIGGREQRAAERYENRAIVDAVKQEQRQVVAEWLCSHHLSNERMRVLSLPDRYWSFENYLHSQRKVTFCGIQRDWKTLELGLPWMPNPHSSYKGGAAILQIKPPGRKKDGVIRFAARDTNLVVYMGAGDFLSTKLDWSFSRSKLRPHKLFRSNTAVWIDLVGPIGVELFVILSRLPLYVRRTKSSVPVVISFLAARDSYQNDEERTAAVIDGMLHAHQDGPRVFKFGKVLKHTSASSPFLSLFGTLERRPELDEKQSTPETCQ